MNYLQEDNFISEMTATIQPWLGEHLTEGILTAEDGLNLKYYVLKNPDAKGTITIFHGYCEFFGKYHELSYYFYNQGYSIYMMEQRGHGYSDRDQVEEDMVYVHSFQDYVQDQKKFYEEVVKKEEKPHFLLAHSMGGLTGSLYLEQYPEDYEKAILSSPMHGVNSGSTPDAAVKILLAIATILRWDRKYIPGHHSFVDKNVFEHSSTRSKPRYDYVFNMRREDTHYQTSGASYAWTRASYRGVKMAHRNAGKIKTPFLLIQAGKDTMVKLEGQDEFLSKCNIECKKITFPESKHEVFNSVTEDREKFYDVCFTFLGENSEEFLKNSEDG